MEHTLFVTRKHAVAEYAATATIHIHPALAADHKAAQALADRLGLEAHLAGNHLALVNHGIPAAGSHHKLQHSHFTGGDAA